MEIVLLVSGSQRWDDPQPIYTVLDLYVRYVFSLGRTLKVLHGDCPRGADRIVRRWVERYQPLGWPVHQQRQPADWSGPCRDTCKPNHRRWSKRYQHTFCPSAGIYRNIAMCELRPDFCEAFIRDNSPGTTNCADYADRLGIPVHRTLWGELPDSRERLAGGIIGV